MTEAGLVAAVVALSILFAGEAMGLRSAQEPTVADASAVSTVAPGRRWMPGGIGRSAAAGAGGAVVGGALAGISGVVIVGIAGVLAPVMIRRRRAAAATARLDEQMLDFVTALASSMRTGRSLEQALAITAGELEAPLGPSVAAMADRVALGTSVDETLSDWANDLGSADARLVVGVLRLHRRIGGSLSGPLDELITTLRARRAGARELRSLTAQARLSAAILGLLPVGFFLFLSVVSRRDIEQAIVTPAGAGAIGVGLTLQSAAFVWIRSLLRLDDV